MLAGKKILLGISGSIAAYKTPFLIRLLIKSGAEVKVVMSPSAKDFVSVLTLSTLSKNTVAIDLFNEESWANHVALGRWADLMIIAPLSCNTLSKMAIGLCDNLLLATYLSATCPVLVAPAMDEDMWEHNATKSNLEKIRQIGCMVMDVAFGELASGLIGKGRMLEPEEIVNYIEKYFQNKNELIGKKVLVTAGPTYEPVDPVRFIGNHSTGKMGFALADELASRGADVTLISGPVHFKPNYKNISLIQVTTARSMFEACLEKASDYNIAILAAAVADYTPVSPSEFKIKKVADELVLTLKKTDDILANLGKRKKDGQFLVGFALETNNEEKNALMKLENKNADAIILNSMNDAGAGFAVDTNKVTIYFKNGIKKEIGLKSKISIAEDIVNSILENNI